MGSKEFALGAELALRQSGVTDANKRTQLMQQLQQFNMGQATDQQEAVNQAMAKYNEMMTPKQVPVSQWEPAFGTKAGVPPSFDELARGMFPSLLKLNPAVAMQMLQQTGQETQDPNAALRRQMTLEAFKSSLGGYKPRTMEEALILKEAGITEPKPYYQVVQTSEGYKLVDTRSGNSQPLLNKEGQPVMPIQADVKLAGEKKRTELDVKATKEKEMSFAKAQSSLSTLNRQWDMVDKMIDKALAQIGPFTAGFGAYLKSLPASQAKNLEENLNTIRANIGFDKLQDMRANSPTGGALGQVSDLENRLLQATQGSLDQFQSYNQLRDNLISIKNHLQGLKAQKSFAFNYDYQDLLKGGTTGAKPTVGPTTIKYDSQGNRVQ